MPAVTRRQYKGAAAQTTITNALAAGDTSATLAATTGWPSTAAVPFYVVISPGTANEEKCSATISGSVLTLTRAQDDTTAQSHASGATIYPVFSADDADEANKLASTLTTRGDLLTMDSGPDFKRLALGSANTVLKSDGSDASWGSVAAANLASSAVETAKINDAAVTGAKLANFAVNTSTDDYTLVVGDRNTRRVANKATAITFTVPDSVFSAGDTLEVHNINTGVLTIAAGAGVTLNGADVLTVAQWQGGTLYFTSASSAIFFPTAKTVSAGGLIVVKAETAFTAASSVTADNVFTSTYTNYMLRVRYQTSAATPLSLRLRVGGVAATTNYNDQYVDGNSTSASAFRQTAQGNIDIGNTSDGAFWSNSTVNIYGPQLAEATTFDYGNNYSNGGYTTLGLSYYAANHSTATAYDGLELLVGTGTMTGSYTIYGLAKS